MSEIIRENDNGRFYKSSDVDAPELEEFVSKEVWESLTDDKIALIKDVSNAFCKNSKLLDYSLSNHAKSFSTTDRNSSPTRSFSYRPYEEDLELGLCYGGEKDVNENQLSIWLMVRHNSAYVVPFFPQKGDPVSYEEYSPSNEVEENMKKIATILANHDVDVNDLPDQIKPLKLKH